MYSCEKLAKGGKSRFESDERKHHISLNPIKNIKVNSKFEYDFANPRKYSVKIALYEDRPRGRGRVLSKRK